MADRWTDDRDRQWRDRNWRSDAYGRGGRDEERRFGGRGEDRSFGGGYEDEGQRTRVSGPDRDRVFGERDTGAEYNRGGQQGGYRDQGGYGAEQRRQGGGSGGQGSGSQSFGGQGRGQGGGDWQDRHYGGVSPAMRQGEYDMDRERGQDRTSGRGGMGGGGMPRFQSQDYTQGGRFYGDDRRQPIYREEYGQGGREYGEVPRGYDAGRDESRHGNRQLEDRYRDEMSQRWSGGTGGYDYERGYGDAGRPQSGGRDRWDERTQSRDEDRNRGGMAAGGAAMAGAGDFLHRAGEKLSSWFGGGAGGSGDRTNEQQDEQPRRYATDFGREPNYDLDRGHRGRGPKGYQRPDERIDDEVHQRLTDDPWLDASNISVQVSGGEVTLTGTVENREAKHRAERCVEDIPGVNHVQNNLRINSGGLTSAGRGFGDSALEAQMRDESGEGGATSSGKGSEVNGGTAAGQSNSDMSRSPTRRS